MDFDLDDPLGSDDSFFEEPKALAKRGSITKTPEKKTLDSLLGFTAKSTETVSKPEVDDLFSRPKSTVTFEDSKTDVATKTKPMDDWLSDAPKITKKTDLLDDILSIKPKSKPDKKGTSLEDILKESKANISSKSTSLKDISNAPTEGGTDYGFTTSLPERRRGRRGSGVEDNLGLGLFSDEYQVGDYYTKDKKQPQTKLDTAPKSATTGVPDWLGIGAVTTSKRAESPSAKRNETPYSQPVVPKEQIQDNPPQQQQQQQQQQQHSTVNPTSEIPQQLTPQNINTEIQNTYSSLHQQESLLLVSLQFKKYEQVLNEIQNKQHDILGQQEKQFKNFVDEYIVKQQMVENNIRLQQERINQQIQLLVGEPINRINKKVDDNENSDDEKDEKPQDNLIRKLKLRHDEELFLMEESYKKQMDLIEKSATNVEDNLRNEIKNISNIFEEKLNNVKSNHEEEILYYKEKLKTVEEEYSKQIKLLKENYQQKIEELKTEHAMQIDYIKEMKEKESKLLSEGNEFSQKIDNGVHILNTNVLALKNLEEKVNKNYDVLSIAREQSIQAKEREIELMKNTLEKCREAAENERAQLLSLVRNLELKLAEQSTNAQEDRWSLQQASAILTARSKAIEKEAEYNRNIIEREREQLKTLKETLLAEQEKIILQLTEEKLQLASEKVRFETSTKLTNTYEVQRAKAEAETAIEEAKNLSEKLNHERNNLQRQKNELHTLKCNLNERERELEDKEAELEFLMHDAQRKLREDKQVLTEAKRMETMYKERMKELQAQWALLSNREKKLSEDKILLSRERLALYTSMKASKDCVLCNTGGEGHFGKITSFDSHTKISDPTAMKIRLDALDDEESEVSKEGSNSNK